MTGEAPTIADASTVIVLREVDGELETFMVCRHQRSGFLGGAHVFPGGKVDQTDVDGRWLERIDANPSDITARLGEDDADRSVGLLIAGVRETFEEAGVLLAATSPGADLVEARRALNQGASFVELANTLDIRIDAGALTPYARWVTPKMESRRFDTRFYLATVPEGQDASHDGSETTSAVWLRPQQALDDMLSAKIKLAPPTVRTLRWLAECGDIASAVANASSRKPPLIRPRLVAGDAGWFLALPGDPDHPEDEAVLPGSTRMVLDGAAWVDAP